MIKEQRGPEPAVHCLVKLRTFVPELSHILQICKLASDLNHLSI